MISAGKAPFFVVFDMQVSSFTILSFGLPSDMQVSTSILFTCPFLWYAGVSCRFVPATLPSICMSWSPFRFRVLDSEMQMFSPRKWKMAVFGYTWIWQHYSALTAWLSSRLGGYEEPRNFAPFQNCQFNGGNETIKIHILQYAVAKTMPVVAELYF